MRLNLINQALIVSKRLPLEQGYPRLGSVSAISPSKFKFTPTGNRAGAVLVERVDLGELLKGIPQDISGLVRGDSEEIDEATLAAKLQLDMDVFDVPLDNVDTPVADDELSQWFATWKDFIGLQDLNRWEVELGLAEDTLIIDASKASLYCGTVLVKVK